MQLAAEGAWPRSRALFRWGEAIARITLRNCPGEYTFHTSHLGEHVMPRPKFKKDHVVTRVAVILNSDASAAYKAECPAVSGRMGDAGREDRPGEPIVAALQREVLEEVGCGSRWRSCWMSRTCHPGEDNTISSSSITSAAPLLRHNHNPTRLRRRAGYPKRAE